MNGTSQSGKVAALPATYEVGAQVVHRGSPELTDVLAAAHDLQLRPRCMCLSRGVEMYVARFGDRYVVKRMPNTGYLQALDRGSFEAPPDVRGAIRKDAVGDRGECRCRPHDTETRLLHVEVARGSATPCESRKRAGVAPDGARLSLPELLHFLWERAGLTLWRPESAEKRNWGVVRWHLLRAAEMMLVRGQSLALRLYVPEVFCAERREAIAVRRREQWADIASSGRHRRLGMGSVPSWKHAPWVEFRIDVRLSQQMERQYAEQLAVWDGSDQVRMILSGTFCVDPAGVPALEEICLMSVTNEWLPVQAGVRRLGEAAAHWLTHPQYGVHPLSVGRHRGRVESTLDRHLRAESRSGRPTRPERLVDTACSSSAAVPSSSPPRRSPP
jgi:hypothetical protein